MTASPALPLPPGRLGWPVLGETLSFFRDPDYARRRHQQYGDVFKTRLLGQPTVFVKGAEATGFVLTHENDYFQVSWPPSVKALLGSRSLALQTGAVHLQRRKLMAQAFQPRALADYLPTMVAISDRYCQRWAQSGELVWYPELRRYTFDIAAKLLMGLDDAASTELGIWFEIWNRGLFSIPLNLPWTRFGQAWRCRRLMLNRIEQLIRQRQTQPDSDADQTDALGILLSATDETGERLTIAELKDQILLLLFAGHETLTSALSSFCLLMAQYPEMRAQARAEQTQFQAQPLTLDRLKQMTYLEQILKEVMRLIAPVGGGFRQVLKPCEIGGYQIPVGWSVLYEINLTHQDATQFPQPDQFDPARFAPPRSEDRGQPFALVPFGGGLRECLGKEFARLEMKVFAAKLLQQYTWELLPDQDTSLITVPTPHPRDGLRVKFRECTTVAQSSQS